MPDRIPPYEVITLLLKRYAQLSNAEAKVFYLKLQGKKNQKIADEWGVSLATVSTHFTHIYSILIPEIEDNKWETVKEVYGPYHEIFNLETLEKWDEYKVLLEKEVKKREEEYVSDRQKEWRDLIGKERGDTVYDYLLHITPEQAETMLAAEKEARRQVEEFNKQSEEKSESKPEPAPELKEPFDPKWVVIPEEHETIPERVYPEVKEPQRVLPPSRQAVRTTLIILLIVFIVVVVFLLLTSYHLF